MAEAREDMGISPDELSDTDPNIEVVKDETEKVFRNFVYRRLTSHIDKEATEGELELASIQPTILHNLRDAQEELEDSETNSPDKAKINALGRTLAEYGDEIQHKYHDTFSEMMSKLDITKEFAFSSFTTIARKLFENGINWGRIIALLCFGYEIAETVIKQGVHGVGSFLRKIIKFVVSFIVKEHIATWIAKQGGWQAFTMNQNGGAMFMGVIFALAALGGAYTVYRYTKGGGSN